jgi:hypothetical protein
VAQPERLPGLGGGLAWPGASPRPQTPRVGESDGGSRRPAAAATLKQCMVTARPRVLSAAARLAGVLPHMVTADPPLSRAGADEGGPESRGALIGDETQRLTTAAQRTHGRQDPCWPHRGRHHDRGGPPHPPAHPHPPAAGVDRGPAAARLEVHRRAGGDRRSFRDARGSSESAPRRRPR